MPNGLPKPDYRKTLNYDWALNGDIIRQMQDNFPVAVNQTKDFSKRFASGSHETTALNVWKFLRSHIQYNKDPKDEQLIRLPSRFIHDANGDCKSYALCAAALLASNGLPVRFRFANYKEKRGTTPTHVYTVTEDEKGNDIIVDGCFPFFNAEKRPYYKFDKSMKVYTLSDDVGALRGKRRHRLSRREMMLHRLCRRHFRGETLHDVLNGIESCSEVSAINGIYEGINKRHRRHRGNFFKKLGKGLKKIGLAPARRAYRTLVSINFGGLAKKLKRAFDKNPKRVAKKWAQLGGGNVSTLKKSVKRGYNHWAKHHHKGAMTGLYGVDLPILQYEAESLGWTEDIGTPAAAAIIAAAAPVIAALSPLLKSSGADAGSTEGDTSDAGSGKEMSVDKITDFAKDAVSKFNEATDPEGAKLSAEDPTNPENAEKFDTDENVPDEPDAQGSFFSPIGFMFKSVMLIGLYHYSLSPLAESLLSLTACAVPTVYMLFKKIKI